MSGKWKPGDYVNYDRDENHAAWQGGFDAYGDGEGLDANPYRGEAVLRQVWAEGWGDARLDAKGSEEPEDKGEGDR